MNKSLIAPCGINCNFCFAHLREKNKCPGCNASDEGKCKTRLICKIKNCVNILNNKSGLCSECEEFPCTLLKKLDKRYSNKYNLSVIENLEHIRNSGIETFLKDEQIKWTCKKCSSPVCIHTGRCTNCKEV